MLRISLTKIWYKSAGCYLSKHHLCKQSAKMKRATLICSFLLFCVVTTSLGVNTNDVARDHYHPAAVPKPHLIEQFDKRFDDGHYEYSYSLSNGDKRYEHAYWQPVGNNNVLARKGYYSYPLPNNKYLTVFYTSDQNGFQQDFSSYSNAQPSLPRSIDAPSVPVKPLPVYVSSTTAHPPVYVTSPAPSYIITSGGHYAWDQSNRVKRNTNTQEVTNTLRQNTGTSTTRGVSTTTPIPTSSTRAPISSSTSVLTQLGQPGSSQVVPQISSINSQLGWGPEPLVAATVHTQTQTNQPGSQRPQQQQQVSNQEYQNALLNYLVSRVSRESLESSSSESREYYRPGISRPRHWSAAHDRRSGNRPIWQNQPAQQTLSTFVY